MLELNSNPFFIPLADIPVLDYPEFMADVKVLMADEGCHCVTYHAVPLSAALRFFCCIASDTDHKLFLFSHIQKTSPPPVLDSLTPLLPSFHLFEREIREQYGVEFTGHPWIKPVRFHYREAAQGIPETRTTKPASSGLHPYPFYTIGGEGIHEVGVGPIHAGVIEPGYFRFICNGEKVLHLEIKPGFQHRGVEKLFIEKQGGIQRAVLAENIAGDTAVGHSIAHTQLIEILAGFKPSARLQAERIIALELERIAVHIGDTAALCTDIAYQFGQVVNEALRTIIINTTQAWCGNRFGKGLVRSGGSNYRLNKEITGIILANIREAGERYAQITHEMFTNPSVLSRFEGTGKVSAQQAGMIGTVGMAARSSGVKRDIRWSHPFQAFGKYNYEPVTLHQGDVWARAMLRKAEVEKSIVIIREILSTYPESRPEQPVYESTFPASVFALSLAEGWRGEIMQSAVTDEKGNIIHYPLCNKSYNLSYCGFDL